MITTQREQKLVTTEVVENLIFRDLQLTYFSSQRAVRELSIRKSLRKTTHT